MARLAAFLLSALLVPFAALGDPPGRVGRLSLVEGEAAVFADPELGWQGARVNTPLTSENSVWTEPGARAEVRFGAVALRLGETTQLDIHQLDDLAFRGHLARGSLTARIHEFAPDESFTVTTPQARFHLRGNGRYRIDAGFGRGESLLTVFEGHARLETVGGTISVDTGRSVRVTGGERARYEFELAVTTGLDEWALARDRRFEAREAARYVPPQVTGWEDLDDYGVWRNEAEYGAVWFPTRVEAGWAPYRYGRWTWVRPWGWTWVDDSPWGYAPFHYGRWVNVGNRWGWYPGRYTGRPVWAPALVGWIGQPGWSVSISTGPVGVVGWYPLSPYDRYQPWYRANVTYVNNVNHVVIPPRHDRGRRDDRQDYRRDNRDRGATVVPREQFGTHRPVQSVRAPVPGEVVAAQPVVSGIAVLPSQGDWRTRAKPVDAAPRAPSRGETVSTPRPSLPPSPAPSMSTSRPAATPTQAPAYPAAPASRPPTSVARPKPTEPVAQPDKPSAAGRPAPTDPAMRAKPVPVQPAEKPVHAQPVQKPVPATQAQKPVPAQPVQKPAQVRPAEKPEAAREKPARGTDRPAGEKPGKPADPGQGG